MNYEVTEVRTAKKKGYVQDLDGKLRAIPQGWKLLPPGDPALSRRIKKAHDCWIIKEPKGKRLFSKGILSDAATIDRLKAELEVERADPSYQKKLDAGRARRAKQEEQYGQDFLEAVISFLDFDPIHAPLAQKMATLITAHAIPVGSNTVARTKRIPLDRKAEAAVIAWMRHQTTAYDHMKIARVKGARREVRRDLAKQSRKVLEKYRKGITGDQLLSCPLYKSLR